MEAAGRVRARDVFRQLVPPILLSFAREGLRTRRGGEEGGVRGPEFYDRSLARAPHYLKHYTASPHYFLWAVMVDRLRALGPREVLEIGCGTGQLACAIRDSGVARAYCGFDFSRGRIAHARSLCPGYRFEVADAYTTDLYRTCEYDTVIAAEILEHLEGDLRVLGQVRKGALVVATVPNFADDAHVRHFDSGQSVAARYSDVLAGLKVDRLRGDDREKSFFLLQGEAR